MRDETPEPGALLPNGMLDGLPDVAERENQITQSLLRSFAAFGYRQVNPPLVEFEDSLLAESGGAAIAKNTFRLMDPVSRRMMAIRSDATTQLVRIAASRLKSQARPLRLSYVADILRVKGSQLRPERQFRQVGCELMGADTLEASVETALLAVVALSQAGVATLSIDFTAPEIIRALIPDDASEAFVKACQRRDDDALKKFGAVGKTLISLNQVAGPADEFFQAVKKLKLDETVVFALNRLEQVIAGFHNGLQAYGLENIIIITVDPLETHGFEYETSPSFTLFAKGIRGELGRGGFYEAAFQLSAKKFHREPANGFTLYMDSILRAVPRVADPMRIYVPPGTSWADIRRAQGAGLVVRGLSGKSVKDIQSLGCTHIYKSGKIQKV